jgi:hypothetical protein
MRMRKKALSQASLEEIMESNEETGAVQAKLGGPDLRLAGLSCLPRSRSGGTPARLPRCHHR